MRKTWCEHYQAFCFHLSKQIPSSQIGGPFLHLNWPIFEIKELQSYQVSFLHFALLFISLIFTVNSSFIWNAWNPDLWKDRSREIGWHSQLNTLTNMIMFKSLFAKTLPKSSIFSVCLFYPLLYFKESISTPPLCSSLSCELVSCSHRDCFSRTVHISTTPCSSIPAPKSIFIYYKN